MAQATRRRSRSHTWLLGLALLMATSTVVTAGVSAGASVAFAVQAFRRSRGWATTAGLTVAVITAAFWMVAWMTWTAADEGAFGPHPGAGVLKLLLASVAVGLFCWGGVEVLSRRKF